MTGFGFRGILALAQRIAVFLEDLKASSGDIADPGPLVALAGVGDCEAWGQVVGQPTVIGWRGAGRRRRWRGVGRCGGRGRLWRM